jgi:hypothetical protein
MRVIAVEFNILLKMIITMNLYSEMTNNQNRGDKNKNMKRWKELT